MIKNPDFSKLKQGDLFRVTVEKLHPTQFCIGIVSAECKRRSIEEYAVKGELQQFLCQEGHLVPVIIGPPGKTLYLTDHHHLCAALWRADLPQKTTKEVVAYVIHDWSDMEPQPFWDRMNDNQLAWLYQYGVGPLSPSILPTSVGGILNDPYRTLARWIRDAGCYVKDELKDQDRPMCDEDSFSPPTKNTAYFIEFRWANFLRENITLAENPHVFHLACELMPRHPAGHFLREVKTLREALPQVIKLIGCNQLTKVSYDDMGCLQSAKPIAPKKKC
jgi:hypothetical protein